MMCDEIQAVLGRAGHLLSYMASGIQPDIVTIGKSLGGGLYPITAVLGKTEVMTALDKGQYGATFSGNPLGAHISLAAVNVIVDEDLCARSRALGDVFAARAAAIKSPYYAGISGRALFRCIWLKPDQTVVTPHALAQRCLELGVFVTKAENRIRTCPSLVISEEDLLRALDVIEQAMNDVAAAGKHV